MSGGNKGRAWPSSALEGGRGGEAEAPEGRQLWDFLGIRRAIKKSQYDDFSRKVQFGRE